jgi:hypothetical protein
VVYLLDLLKRSTITTLWDALEDDSGNPAIEFEKLIIPEACSAMEETGIQCFALNERVSSVVVAEHVRVISNHDTAQPPWVLWIDHLSRAIDHAIVQRRVHRLRKHALGTMNHEVALFAQHALEKLRVLLDAR